MNTPRYTTLGLFAVPVAPGRFLRQAPQGIPLLDFVLSVTPFFALPLYLAFDADFALSLAQSITFEGMQVSFEDRFALSVTGELDFTSQL